MSPTDEFTHDDEHKTDAAEGDWISNEPPVDDFGDSSAEEATVSEGDDRPPEDAAAGSPPVATEAKERRSPILFIAGAVIGLGLVAGIAYWQFGGHRQEQSSLLDMAAQGDAPPPMNDLMKDAPSPRPPAALTAAASSAAPAASVAPTTAFGASVAPDTPASTAKAPLQPAGQPTTQQTGSTVPSAAAAPEPASAASNAATDARLSALSSRIDDLQKSLNQATQQMGQISEKLTENQIPAAPAAAGAPADPATTERLNKLEQKLMQIEQQHPASSTAHVAAVDETAPVRTVHRSRHAEKPKATHHKLAAAHGAPNQGMVSTWVLRAATPEEAWVAKSTSSRELRPVHIGDDLPGVGKITMIRQDGDIWTLQGTTGVVH